MAKLDLVQTKKNIT